MNDIPKQTNNSQIPNKKSKNKKKIFAYIAFALCTFFLAGFLGVYTAINFGKLSLMDMLITMMPQSGFDNNVNILVAGVDATDGAHRTDTIMLVHLDSNKNRVGVISIPRDTRVEVPGHGFTKVNHAYAFGGIDLSVKTVSAFLQVPIQYYVVINLDGVVNVIDQLGGITVDVPKRMYYVDKAGELYIDLRPGKQVLSGKQAMGYVRYRHDAAGDIGRIKRQQDFMKAVADKIIQSGNIFKAPQLFKQLTSNFSTNLTTKQLLLFGLKMRTAFAANNIVIDTVPGGPVLLEGLSYWRPDVPSTLKLVDKVIQGIENVEKEGPADMEPTGAVSTEPGEKIVSEKERQSDVNKAIKAASTMNPKNSLGEGVKLSTRAISKIIPTLQEVSKGEVLPDNMNLSVEILNGSGYPFIAKKIARELKVKGIKVPWVGNAAHFNYNKTIIVDWKGLTKEVLQLSTSLKIDPKNIITYNKPNKKLDVTIVIGKDWKDIKGRL
ncbi:MAG: hypothetical protein DKM50_12555 [Candidatus Margulisiibacteriota bacterium]|nr:MAG: hypothetical protein A2X43_11015 [Candidatus Margulisbacteria bacterium GWD2_39_127]OGI02760.1 MAG: hypothetical protein A2X42_01840 [Candidatus Margulisbacteria bacterium GWF2_38_17]OGI09353.1 MAG: hypothetical protein A2X41_09535 [Candidatus Margulisbacteria bacterium GWE2_39_32]PZM77432.1 MAG: hypothetical protein DKM50_12555 [Candidatus Margulisiibacteriota bacterium]HAR64005.1 hypothetical protein [Candidatus Margulisiibacteriota bacterium]